jgi:hypothetical protein
MLRKWTRGWEDERHVLKRNNTFEHAQGSIKKIHNNQKDERRKGGACSRVDHKDS